MRAKTYTCDDCKCVAEFSSYIKAREADWAVSKDYSKCYCPSCAPAHRRGGANTRQKQQVDLSDSFLQLNIADI